MQRCTQTVSCFSRWPAKKGEVAGRIRASSGFQWLGPKGVQWWRRRLGARGVRGAVQLCEAVFEGDLPLLRRLLSAGATADACE